MTIRWPDDCKTNIPEGGCDIPGPMNELPCLGMREGKSARDVEAESRACPCSCHERVRFRFISEVEEQPV